MIPAAQIASPREDDEIPTATIANGQDVIVTCIVVDLNENPVQASPAQIRDALDLIVIANAPPIQNQSPQPLTGRVTPSPTQNMIAEATEPLESLVRRFEETTDTFSTVEGMRLLRAGHRVPFGRLDTRHH